MNATALIVIDMQFSFLDPNGENHYPAVSQVIEPIRRLLDAARKNKCLIVHTIDRHRPGLPDFEQIHLPPHGIEGTAQGAFFEGFGPKQGCDREIEIVKRRYSAFFATDLALTLRECGITRVIICGVKTNVCVRSTAQDAFAHGFAVHIAREATNSNRPHLAEATLEDIERYFGRVVDVDSALAMLSGGQGA